MIKDKLKYAKNYYQISENLKFGLEWLQTKDFKNIPDGKYDLKNGIYANIQTYKTKDKADYEIHKKYIDIQYIVSGEEFVGVADKDDCTMVKAYKEDADIEFLTLNSEENYECLKKGEILILFPHDAHKPSINPNEQTTVKKIVVKVPVN